MSWYSLLWKASLPAGLLLVVTGSVALSVGLLLPPQIEGFGEGELLMVDERAIGHNGMLAACRLAGGLLLALGGTVLLACTLASPICRAMERIRDDGTYRPGASESPRAWPVPNISPIQSMLPVSLSPTFSVQPKSGL
ncbi:neurensin-1-like [Megalops cyprinoides]|uniref:neurensin-1-like n=1 Tax=Megalops cyprinoides TaxID=118141 RepID=UPI001864A3F9|nr:neurensin-1-like [Megalops cyprinoides]